ncbi:MAG: mechanosensitive ion channel domain-containing protein [Betaproteobacteria bacterium]
MSWARALPLLAAALIAPAATAQLNVPGLGPMMRAEATAPAASAPTRADLERELALARTQQSQLQRLADSGAAAPPLLEQQRNLVARWRTLLEAQLLGAADHPELAAPLSLAALPAFGAPPHPASDVDALRDQLDDVASRQRRLDLTLEGVEAQLAAGLDQRRKADEALRLRREQFTRARDTQTQERLRAEAEVARLEARIAAIELSRADAARQLLRDQRSALTTRQQALAAEFGRVRQHQAIGDAELAQVDASTKAVRRGLDEERQRLQALVERREADAAEAAREAQGRTGGGAGAPADPAVARELRALRGHLAVLGELDGLEAIGEPAHRDEARGLVGRAAQQLALRAQAVAERLQQARSALRAERLRLELLAGAAPGPAPSREVGAAATARARERRALDAMQGEVDALELLQERLLRLQRLLERSRDDLAAAEAQRPPPLRDRLVDALRDGARAVWLYELFTVSESSLVDGRTITLEHGVTVGKAVGVLLLFVVGWFAARRLSRALIGVAVQRRQQTPQLGRVLNRWVLALLLLAVLVVVLELAHIPLTAFAFLGGALAIGVGFGTQNIIKNLISGVIILFERKIRVGDIVTIDNISGTVTSVDLRATTLLGFDGIEAIVPNSQLLENRVGNWSHGNPVVRRAIDVGLRYGDDARAAAALVLACAQADPGVLPDPAPEVLFADFGADAQVLRLQYWIRLGGPRVGPQVDSDLRHAITAAFAERGFVIAFPQRDVHVDVAGPLAVRLQGAS